MNQNKIYVGNLAYTTTEEELSSFFGQYGDIQETKLIMDPATGRSKGFAFITFDNQNSAQNALDANGTELNGRKIKVNIAKKDERRRGGGGGGRRNPRVNSDQQRW